MWPARRERQPPPRCATRLSSSCRDSPVTSSCQYVTSSRQMPRTLCSNRRMQPLVVCVYTYTYTFQRVTAQIYVWGQRDRNIRVCVCVCVCMCVCCVCRSVYVNASATSSYHHLDESKRQKLLCALRLRFHEIKASCTPRWCDRAHMRGEEKSPRRVDVQNAINTHAYICMCTCICFHTKFTEIGTIRRSRYDPTRELIGS